MGLRRKSVQNLSAFFSTLFSSSPAVDEGLYWLSIWSADGTLDSESFNDILQRLVVPKLLHDEGTALVWKLQNTSPDARRRSVHGTVKHGGPGGACALIARLQDVEMMWTSQALQKLATGRRDGNEARVFGTEAKTFQLVQRFDGRKGSKARGSCVIAVMIEPAIGQADDIDAWYRQEHLHQLATLPMFLRSTRYKLRTGLVHGANDSAPALLALHECTSAQALLDYAIQRGQIAPETTWSKRVFAEATFVERTIWDITGKYTQADAKLDHL